MQLVHIYLLHKPFILLSRAEERTRGVELQIFRVATAFFLQSRRAEQGHDAHNAAPWSDLLLSIAIDAQLTERTPRPSAVKFVSHSRGNTFAHSSLLGRKLRKTALAALDLWQ